ncbi:MAG: hypothetical protein ABI683_01750 [Ginsengibacter sp.]
MGRKTIIISVFLVISSPCFSQIFGGNPPSTKWRQINTTSSRIIFPADIDSVANRIASIVDFIKEPTENTIGSKSRKINIVLQNQSTISNAYVGLGPYRSEFYLNPDPNSFEVGSLPWPDQLTIHEYRHVEQFNNFNLGLSHIMRSLFGEEGQALANNAAIPNWFFEGDAVYNETNVSKQGRGSLPFFYNGYRSLWNNGKNYSWMKLRNGSFKDFVPDHYDLGYLLVAYGHEKYGDKFWQQVTHDAAAYKGLFYPFQKAIKKYSGTDYVHFRNDAIEFFKKQFNIRVSSTIANKEYLSQEYPAFQGDTLVYLRSGYKKIPEFIAMQKRSERRIRVRDFSLDNYFSLKNGKIVYASYRPDARWGNIDYSDLRIIDIKSGKQTNITNHTKYFSPDINEDGTRIVAVNQTGQSKSYLHILETSTGELVHIIPNRDQLFYTYPKFIDDNAIISPVRDTLGKMALAKIDASSGNAEYLTPFTYRVVGFPCIYQDTIYFTSSFQKNDELFAYTLASKKLWRIVYDDSVGLGKYEPAVNDSMIAWTTFTSAGYKLDLIKKSDVVFEELNQNNLDENTSSFGVASINNLNSNLVYSVPNDLFTVKKYSKTFRLFNFHSLEPTIDDPEYTLTLLSENILNTMQSQLYFTYDRAEQFKKTGFQATYGALFPFLSSGISYTIDRRTFNSSQKPVYFNELEPYGGFNIPLNLSKGRSFTYINFGSQYVYNSSSFKGSYKDTIGTVSYSYLNNFISFTQQIQKAKQQIFPHFAQSLVLSYKSALTNYSSNQFIANGNIYFPGLMTTHSVVINGAFLAKDTLQQINFSSGFPFSRGYEAVNFYRMYKWGINYHFPLIYPDAGFASIFYLLRVRGNVFYDHTYVKDFLPNANSYNAIFRSTGVELNFDTKWWNQANISVGVRYSHLFDLGVFGGSNHNRWEIILPVNIFNQ